MIRCVLLGFLFAFLDAPAMAVERPRPGKQDARILSVTYDPEDIVAVSVRVGETLTLQFPKGETLEDLALSDTKHMMRTSKGDHLLYLKATDEMPAQPITIRMKRGDGPDKLYLLEFKAVTGGSSTYLLKFTDPVYDKKAETEKDKKRRAEEEHRKIKRRLEQVQAVAPNRHYSLKRKK